MRIGDCTEEMPSARVDPRWKIHIACTLCRAKRVSVVRGGPAGNGMKKAGFGPLWLLMIMSQKAAFAGGVTPNLPFNLAPKSRRSLKAAR
jgi:hypothetical protein